MNGCEQGKKADIKGGDSRSKDVKRTCTSNVYAWMDRKGFQSQRLCVEPISKMQTLVKSEDIKNLSKSQKKKIE